PASLCRVSTPETSIRNAVTASGKSGRRTGAIVVCDAQSRLVGIFTDSDLARLLASGEESVLDHAIGTRMTRECKWTTTGTRYDAFVSQMNDAKISELPVVDDSGAWCGLIDATDLGIGIQVDEAATAAPSREQNQPIESVAGRPRLSIVSPEQDHQGTHFDA
ncbi:MAG: CBS domain-containing protein, partial [Planctomycetota bacterium]